MTFTQNSQTVVGFGPVDMSSGNNTGQRVDVGKYKRIRFVFTKAAGTAGDDPTLTLRRHTAASGGTSADWVAIDKVYIKQGTQSGIGQVTVVEQTAAATYTNDTLAEAAAVIIVDVKTDGLPDGYNYVSADVADVGDNAQLGSLNYELYEPRYAQEVTPSAL